MYIKIIGCIVLVTAAAAIGFFKAEELRKRVFCLMELKRMMLLLQGELRFHRATLSEAFLNVSKRVEEPFASFLTESAKGLEDRVFSDFNNVWGGTTKKLIDRGSLDKEDNHLLEQLGRGLGYLDLTMQTETLNLAILQTEEAICLAKEQKEMKGKLYQTMGVTAGAFFALLII